MRYARVKIGGKVYDAHRVIWEMHNGSIPVGHVIHHIDRNPRNNDISNLMCLSRAEHQALHRREDGEQNRPAKAFTCQTCGIAGLSKHHTPKFCSTVCRNKARYAA